MVVFILIKKKKEAIFQAQARPLPGGDGTAQSRCTDPVWEQQQS